MRKSGVQVSLESSALRPHLSNQICVNINTDTPASITHCASRTWHKIFHPTTCAVKVKISPTSDGQADGQTFGQNPPQSSLPSHHWNGPTPRLNFEPPNLVPVPLLTNGRAENGSSLRPGRESDEILQPGCGGVLIRNTKRKSSLYVCVCVCVNKTHVLCERGSCFQLTSHYGLNIKSSEIKLESRLTQCNPEASPCKKHLLRRRWIAGLGAAAARQHQRYLWSFSAP